MEVSKDVYEYLTNFADDKTILNMLSVNKKFNDEQFFRRVLERKYPLLIKFKKEEESYKALFIRMVYALSKLKEDFDIPYIPHRDYNPFLFYMGNKTDEGIYNYAMTYAARTDLDLVKFLITKGGKYSIYNRDDSVREGKIAIVDFFLSKNSDLNWFLSQSGSAEMAKFLIQKGADDLNRALQHAVYNGRRDVVNFLIQEGANDWNRALIDAAYEGYLDLVKLLVEKGANNISEGLNYAQAKERMDVVQYLEERL